MKKFGFRNCKFFSRKAIFIAVIAILLLPCALFITFEIHERSNYRSKEQQDIDIWRAVLYSELVNRNPNTKFAFRLYGISAEKIYEANLSLNNLGLISSRNYKLQKESNEFRILVLGGEQSASTVANISWPDALEDKLNKDSNSKKFKVLNFAWPDAGPEHYIEYWKNEAVKYAPDLVIVNSPETDFYRTIQGAKLTLRGKELELSQDYKFQIDDVWFLIKVAVTKDNTGPVSLANENVIASRPYGIFPYQALFPIDVVSDKELIRKVLTKLVEDQISAAMPKFGLFTLKKLGLNNEPTLTVSQIRNFDTSVAPSNQEELITAEYGVKVFGWMRRNIPNAIFIHNFHAGEMSSEFRLTNKTMELDPNIQIVDMRSYIPNGTSKEEIASWYLIPHMGEKFSDKGHSEYAILVSNMLCDKGKLPILVCNRGVDSLKN
jgi:hypothetical protein